jgi:hypothetical protein
MNDQINPCANILAERLFISWIGKGKADLNKWDLRIFRGVHIASPIEKDYYMPQYIIYIYIYSWEAHFVPALPIRQDIAY